MSIQPQLATNQISSQTAKVFAAFMEKGGVGKTTTTAHLGYSLASHGRVLLIDGDNQGNLTQHYMENREFAEYDRSLLDVLLGRLPLEDAIVSARPAREGFHGIDLLGTKHHDKEFEDYIEVKFMRNPMVINMIIKGAAKLGYQYILIDLHPSFRFWEQQIISLCDELIPVVQLEEFAVSGFWELMDSLKQHSSGFNAHYRVRFAIANRYKADSSLHRANLEIFSDCPLGVFVCNESNYICNAAAFHQVVHEYRPTHPAVTLFNDLAQSIIQ